MPSLASRAAPFPGLFRLVESGWPVASSGDRHLVPIEEYQDNGNFVVRAELPGMDPERDIQISVEGDELSIRAERPAGKHERAHSEFSYGSFARTLRLPGGAAVDKVSARYDAGILQVTIPLAERHGTRQIPVQGS